MLSITLVSMDVSGVGGVLAYSPSYVAVTQWFDKKKGKAMALSTLGTGLGSVCMAPLIALLVDEYNYFGTMLIIGALLLNNSVGGALYLDLGVTSVWNYDLTSEFYDLKVT